MRIAPTKWQRGDTIIEVLFAITILAVVISSAYAIANRSITTSRLNYERNQAVKYAESQVELYKAASATMTKNQFDAFKANLGSSGSRCIATDLTVVATTSCQRDDAKYTLQVVSVNSGTTETSYMISRVIWDVEAGTNKNVELLYRAYSER